MEWFIWLAIGVVIGLVLGALGVSGAKILAWIEAKIKLLEAQAEAHKASAAAITVQAQVAKTQAALTMKLAAGPTGATGPTGA